MDNKIIVRNNNWIIENNINNYNIIINRIRICISVISGIILALFLFVWFTGEYQDSQIPVVIWIIMWFILRIPMFLDNYSYNTILCKKYIEGKLVFNIILYQYGLGIFIWGILRLLYYTNYSYIWALSVIIYIID